MSKAEQSARSIAISEAAQWFSRLNDKDLSDQEKAQWQTWLQSSEHNQFAWQQMQAINQQCADLPGKIAAPTLTNSQFSRRKLLQSLLSISVLSPLAWLAYRYHHSPQYHAQYMTAVGEIRHLILEDGSELTLNTSTAVDVHFDPKERRIELHSGELHLATSKQYQGAAPLTVVTPHGQVQALGTRFSVRTFADRTLVQVAEDQVKVSIADVSKTQLLSVGEQLFFDQNKISKPSPFLFREQSWIGGSLVVVNMPLGELINELSRYRKGVLSCAPEVEHIKVSGAYPLVDTDRSLAVLAQSFPVKVQKFSSYWVRVMSLSEQSH